MNLSKFIDEDKRKFPRFETRIPCNLVFNENKIPGTIVDLSLNGAKVLPNKDINRFMFNLIFYMNNKILNLKCTRITQIAECISVEFVQIDNLSKSNLNYALSLISIGEDIL